ncbi:MAG: hypothetical protein FWC36_05250 [Spirochaetes bacterium]|nr:hypothetical protein [Spirochaetota bacterium]
MKNGFKFLGILALVALIGFSMISCDNSGPGGDPPPERAVWLEGTSWPPVNVLTPFGLGGKPQPAGASGITWSSALGYSMDIEFLGTLATRNAVTSWLNANGWTLDWEASDINWHDFGWLKEDFFVILMSDYIGGVFKFRLTAKHRGWPPGNVLTSVGLGGKQQPVGVSDIAWSSAPGYFMNMEFLGTLATRDAVMAWLTASPWLPGWQSSGSGWFESEWSRGNFELNFGYEYTGNDFYFWLNVWVDDFSSFSADLAPFGSNLLENESNNDGKSARPSAARRSNTRR